MNKPTRPTISSTSHPDQTVWYGSRSISASWTAASDGSNGSGVAGYAVVLDQKSDTNPTGTLTTSRTYSASVSKDRVWWLHVRARDNVGNWGDTRHYRFRIGTPTVTAPLDGEASAKWVELAADGQTDHTGVTFQYRRDTSGAWQDIPAAAVAFDDTGAAVAWPVAVTDGAHRLLVWNVPATASGFADGPVWVRASFSGGGGRVTEAVLVQLDRAAPPPPTKTSARAASIC